jgi:hypothetical protein
MKHIIRFIYPVIFLWLSVFIGCREPLVSSADERKEALIQGMWFFHSDQGSISLTFKPDLTVDILVQNSVGTEPFTFNFRIEDGQLYFLTFVDSNQEVEFIYDIDQLTDTELILSFVDNSGIRIVQFYVRP